MATSGSTNFTLTAGDIVQDALILLGVSHPEEVLSSATSNWGIQQFNKMIKSMGSQGAKLWALEQATLLFDNDVVAYTFDDKSGSGGDVAVGIKESGLVKTEIATAAVATDTTLTVDSTTGMTASDKVILELDSGDRHETAITSVDSTTVITIDDQVPSASAVDNHVYTYTLTTDEIKHPEQVMNVRLREENDNEIPMQSYSRQEYMRLVDKNVEGRPYVYFYDKQLANRVLYVYPEPDSLKQRIVFDYLKTIEDIDASTDNLYFPDEWLEALTYQLAVRLAPTYGKIDKLSVIGPLAEKYLDEAMQSDNEETSVNFRPMWMD